MFRVQLCLDMSQPVSSARTLHPQFCKFVADMLLHMVWVIIMRMCVNNCVHAYMCVHASVCTYMCISSGGGLLWNFLKFLSDMLVHLGCDGLLVIVCV